MRFLWFEVQGYKNLRAPLRLTDIGRINVLHGDNNVGITPEELAILGERVRDVAARIERLCREQIASFVPEP